MHEAPASSTPGRMPTVAFSDDSDYDALGTLLWKMRHFMWQVEFKDGTSVIGAVTYCADEITVVPLEDGGAYALAQDAAVTVRLDDVVRFVYL
jgi:hypothetical protein